MDIPTTSNFFSTLSTSLTRRELAELYEKEGWRIRKYYRHDYEIYCDWAELVIESEGPVLMHGCVAGLPLCLDELLAPLRRAGVKFQVEVYGDEPGSELIPEIQE